MKQLVNFVSAVCAVVLLSALLVFTSTLASSCSSRSPVPTAASPTLYSVKDVNTPCVVVNQCDINTTYGCDCHLSSSFCPAVIICTAGTATSTPVGTPTQTPVPTNTPIPTNTFTPSPTGTPTPAYTPTANPTVCQDCVDSYEQELVVIVNETLEDIANSALTCDNTCAGFGNPEAVEVCLFGCEAVLDLDDQAKAVYGGLEAKLEENNCLDENDCGEILLAEFHKKVSKRNLRQV